jgi:hypothetical protein
MSLRNFALMTALATAAIPAIAVAETAPIVQPVDVKQPAPARDDAPRYAQREARDTKVADYKGGSTVVIAMSGGAFVVLLVLLLLL